MDEEELQLTEDPEASADQTQLETLLVETNEHFEQLHTDFEILIASVWVLCGVVVGVAVGMLIYKLWRS